MKVIILYLLFSTIFITLSGVSSGAVSGEHTTDEWRSILSVPSDGGIRTGLQISLTIDPDQYYLPFGSSANLSGEVYNIFGPVGNASIVLAKGGDRPVPFENLTTDEFGKFSTADIVNSSGLIRYQIWFEGSDTGKTDRTVSNEIEIRGEKDEGDRDETISDASDSSTIPGLTAAALAIWTGEREEGDDSAIIPIEISGEVTGYNGPESDATVFIFRMYSGGEEQLGYRVTGPEGRFEFTDHRAGAELPSSYRIISESGTPDSTVNLETKVVASPPETVVKDLPVTDSHGSEGNLNQSGFIGISLETDTKSFTSGQNITFSGKVTGLKGTPLSYADVIIEEASTKAFTRIGDSLITTRNGTYSVSYHLTGPSSPTFRAVSSDEKGDKLVSNEVLLSFQSDSFSPLSRDRIKSRHINGNLLPPVIKPGEDITISGWFSDGDGAAIPFGRLNLYWFNFADRIWDKYEQSAEAIANEDGYYSFNVSGPDATGISYMAVVSKQELSGDPLFSHVLPLTVRGDPISGSSILPTRVTAESNLSEVTVNNQTLITFTLSDLTGTPLSGEPLRLYFSEDGFTWYMNGNGNVTTSTEGVITITGIPKRAGFNYYRGVYDGSALYGPADSGILVIPVLESPAGRTSSEESPISVLSGSEGLNTTAIDNLQG